MRIEQVSPHIWSVSVWVLLPVRVWVVVDGGGVTLVDAGLPVMAKGLLRSIGRLGGGPLNRILLTHGHPDHVGAIGAIQRQRPVPLYAHRVEIPYMEGRLAYPGRRKARAAVPQGLVQPLREDAEGGLEAVGGLKPYFTPGHSPGHVVYYHEKDRVLLAGDLFTSRRGKLRPPIPMFTSDMAQALQSSAVVAELRPERLEVSHGGPVLDPAGQLAEYWERNGVTIRRDPAGKAGDKAAGGGGFR